MNAHRFRLTAVLISILVSSCSSLRIFLDPSQPRITYDALTKPAEPLRLQVNVDSRYNGSRSGTGNPPLKLEVTEVLERTGLVAPTDAPGSEGEIWVILNSSHENMSAASSVAAGLTLGFVGTTSITSITHYEMEVVVWAKGKTARQRGIQHAVLFSQGATSFVPDGAEQVVSRGQGFERAVEQMLLRALQGMQKSGDLPQ